MPPAETRLSKPEHFSSGLLSIANPKQPPRNAQAREKISLSLGRISRVDELSKARIYAKLKNPK